MENFFLFLLTEFLNLKRIVFLWGIKGLINESFLIKKIIFFYGKNFYNFGKIIYKKFFLKVILFYPQVIHSVYNYHLGYLYLFF